MKTIANPSGQVCVRTPPIPGLYLHLRIKWYAVPLVQDLYIIQINGFSAFMDDPYKMIAG